MPAQPRGGAVWQGKAVPVEQTAEQLRLAVATAEDPAGSAREVVRDRSRAGRAGVPKATVTEEQVRSAVMEEVIERGDRAMGEGVANRGGGGPDGLNGGGLRVEGPAMAP